MNLGEEVRRQIMISSAEQILAGIKQALAIGEIKPPFAAVITTELKTEIRILALDEMLKRLPEIPPPDSSLKNKLLVVSSDGLGTSWMWLDDPTTDGDIVSD